MGKLFIKFKKNILGEAKIFYLNYKQIFGWVSSDERSKKGDYILIFLVCSKRCDEVSANPY